MKDVRAEIAEYGLDIPKAVEYLQHQSLGLETDQSSINLSDTEPEVPPLPPPDISKEEEIMDDTSVTSCYDTSHNSLLIVGDQVRKFFKVLRWFSGNIYSSFLWEKQQTIYYRVHIWQRRNLVIS